MGSQFAGLLVACWFGEILARVLELFSDGARKVVVEASETARGLGHGFIGAEHLLLGVIAEKQGIGATVLTRLGVTDQAVRRELLARLDQGDQPSEGALPFNQEGKSALERSLVEARHLGDRQIQTEHVLLALMSTGQHTAVELLEALGVQRRRVHREVLRAATEQRGWMAEINDPSFGVWETLSPTGELRRVLAAAAELALESGRSHIELADVLFAIAEDPDAMPLLAELGVQIDRVADLVERHRSRHSPREVGESN
jgi:ATP-dependent Clp protease ATP-binding subunit ClpA